MPTSPIDEITDSFKEVVGNDDIAELTEGQIEMLIGGAVSLYVSLKWPSRTHTDLPELDWIAKNWIVRCAVEMLNRRGAEGQTSHNENSIGRGFDTATVSKSLRREVIPVAGHGAY